MSCSLSRLFAPVGVAIVGATPSGGPVSRLVSYITKFGYRGRVFLVNPKYAGEPGYVGSVTEVDEAAIDVAVIAVRSHLVPSVLDECATRKVPFAIVLTSGFAELGGEGQGIQNDILNIAHDAGIRLLGPNCNGLINVLDRTVLSTASGLEDLRRLDRGSAAFIAQSGGVLVTLLQWAHERGLGLAACVSVGNQADLTAADILGHIGRDSRVRVIGAYLEDIRHPRQFVMAVEQARTAGKAVVLLRGGRSVMGHKAAASHTGALATDDKALDTILSARGVIVVDGLSDLFEAVYTLSIARKATGGRVACLTSSGGGKVLLADGAEATGTQLANFSGATISKLRAILPPFATADNPLDVTQRALDQPAVFRECLTAILEDTNVGWAIVHPSSARQFGEPMSMVVADVANKVAKPLSILWTGGSLRRKVRAQLHRANVPVTFDYAPCLRAVASAMNGSPYVPRKIYGPHRLAKNVATALRQKSSQQRLLDELEAKEILALYGVPIPREKIATDSDSAAALADEIGYPVVLKVLSADVAHKSDIGGVAIDLRSEADVRAAFERINKAVRSARPDARIRGILVQEMVCGGTEFFIGGRVHPELGPLVTFGTGGLNVELERDAVLAEAPLSENEANQLMRHARAAQRLKEFRGRPAGDMPALVDALVAVSQLLSDQAEQLAELDVNPVIVLPHGKGVIAVDALICLAAGGASSLSGSVVK